MKKTTTTSGTNNINSALNSGLNFSLFGISSNKNLVSGTPQKTGVGKALSTIWGGIKGFFTGSGQVQTNVNGSAVTVKDTNGNIIAGKEITNINWQNILAGVGLLIGGITGATTSQSTTQEQLDIENQQQIRTGSNTLLLVGLAIVGISVSIWAYIKFKD